MFYCKQENNFVHQCKLDNRGSCNKNLFTKVCQNINNERQPLIFKDKFLDKDSNAYKNYIVIADNEIFLTLCSFTLTRYKLTKGLIPIRIYDQSTVIKTYNNSIAGQYVLVPDNTAAITSLKLINKYPKILTLLDSYYIE